MSTLDLLREMKPLWLDEAVRVLSRGTGMGVEFRAQLENFYSLLDRSLQTGDHSILDPILSSWAVTQTQTDIEGRPSSLTMFINELLLLSYNIFRRSLDPNQLVVLMDQLIPAFGYIFEKAADFELQTRVADTDNQIAQTKQEMKQLEKSKSAFITVAGHELRTPLTLIDGYTDMLHENMHNANASQTDNLLLQGILKGTQRLKSVINNMLDVSLIDNNRLQLSSQPIWLNHIFNALRTELETNINERNQQFNIVVFKGYSDMLMGDPDRLMQAFRNLCQNAIKFTPDGGKITIDGRSLPGFIEVRISDTGIGIDPDHLAQIFDRFSRVGDTTLHSSGETKFMGGGPGLGLYIAKGIIEAHRGTIWAESPGFDESQCPGTIFHILLPTNQPDNAKLRDLFSSDIDNAASTIG